MHRVNTFVVRPLSSTGREALLDLLDASAALWNDINYERRQAYFGGADVWDAATHYDDYKGVVGSSTAQQIEQLNGETWRSFFATEGDSANHSPPGYWGNEDDGRALRTVIRADVYNIDWSVRSRLEIPVGMELKEKYGLGYNEKLRLEVAGEPAWDGDDCRLIMKYDELEDTFRVRQSVEVDDGQLCQSPGDDIAALDVGANNLVACTTTTGQQYLYAGRDLFDRFRETTEEIARLRSKLENPNRLSQRTRRLFRLRTRRRHHAQDALVRDLVERLVDEGVGEVFTGDLGDVLSSHWKAEVNEKTHLFWSPGRFTRRLRTVAQEYGVEVHEGNEAYTTQRCPNCGEEDATAREGDEFRCENCGFEGHADLKASRVFLSRETGSEVRPTARPVRLEWDNHEWRPTTTAPAVRRATPKEERTDRSTSRQVGKFAAADSGSS